MAKDAATINAVRRACTFLILHLSLLLANKDSEEKSSATFYGIREPTTRRKNIITTTKRIGNRTRRDTMQHELLSDNKEREKVSLFFFLSFFQTIWYRSREATSEKLFNAFPFTDVPDYICLSGFFNKISKKTKNKIYLLLSVNSDLDVKHAK